MTVDPHKTITLEPYGFKLNICITDDFFGKIKSLYSVKTALSGCKNEAEARDYDSCCGGRFLAVNGKATIFVKPDAGGSILVHESFHATEWIMGEVEIPHRGDYNEAWAYMVGYISKHVVIEHEKRRANADK